MCVLSSSTGEQDVCTWMEMAMLAQPRSPLRFLPPTYFSCLCLAKDSESIFSCPPASFPYIPQPDVTRSRSRHIHDCHAIQFLRIFQKWHHKWKSLDDIKAKPVNHQHKWKKPPSLTTVEKLEEKLPTEITKDEHAFYIKSSCKSMIATWVIGMGHYREAVLGS